MGPGEMETREGKRGRRSFLTAQKVGRRGKRPSGEEEEKTAAMGRGGAGRRRRGREERVAVDLGVTFVRADAFAASRHRRRSKTRVQATTDGGSRGEGESARLRVVAG
jgi:hypothetical protein